MGSSKAAVLWMRFIGASGLAIGSRCAPLAMRRTWNRRWRLTLSVSTEGGIGVLLSPCRRRVRVRGVYCVVVPRTLRGGEMHFSLVLFCFCFYFIPCPLK